MWHIVGWWPDSVIPYITEIVPALVCTIKSQYKQVIYKILPPHSKHNTTKCGSVCILVLAIHIFQNTTSGCLTSLVRTGRPLPLPRPLGLGMITCKNISKRGVRQLCLNNHLSTHCKNKVCGSRASTRCHIKKQCNKYMYVYAYFSRSASIRNMVHHLQINQIT